MPYADYSFYTGTYEGTKIPSSLFDNSILKASYEIQKMTLGKSDAYKDSKQVKLATCAVADAIYEEENKGIGISSESVGGHSVTYSDTKTSELYIEEASRYLATTGLLSGVIG